MAWIPAQIFSLVLKSLCLITFFFCVPEQIIGHTVVCLFTTVLETMSKFDSNLLHSQLQILVIEKYALK